MRAWQTVGTKHGTTVVYYGPHRRRTAGPWDATCQGQGKSVGWLAG